MKQKDALQYLKSYLPQTFPINFWLNVKIKSINLQGRGR